MAATIDEFEQPPSSPDIDNSPSLTPTTQSGATSSTNEPDELEDAVLTSQRKKKKKRSKRPAKLKDTAATTQTKTQRESDGRPVLCISRNKHWRYISSYHGPWLQLPLELLDSLLAVNLKPASLFNTPDTFRLSSSTPSASISARKLRDRGHHTLNDYSPLDSPRGAFPSMSSSRSLLKPRPGKAIPPPIDPGVFRSVNSIRRLIDEAAELSVRASSGLTSAELGTSRSTSGLNNNPWASTTTLGINPLGTGGNGGRNVAMSAMRIHRLRALAVQKLAQAYKADEIASSVMIMQGGSVFDDVAERVLRHDPTDLDAKYVHFFHEKIPSRQLAESTSTRVLDELIAARPQHLEYYRTRGIVHCFRDEYTQATKDFTYALKEARAVRKAKAMHRNMKLLGDSRFLKNGKRKKVGVNSHTNGQAPPNGTSPLGGGEEATESADGELQLQHPSLLPDAPDPIEPQLLFLRGAAYLQHAIFLIETAVLKLEGVQKGQTLDGAELRLCYLGQGKYGGVEIGNPDGPLGKSDEAKVEAYRDVLAAEPFREQITALLRKSIRDHERFLSHFDSIEAPNALHGGDIAHQMEYAFLLNESLQPITHVNNAMPSLSVSEVAAIFTTYHPLIVESHFSVLICQLMLGDFIDILPTFARTAAAVDGLDGCPVFLPARSMGQAEFMELLERLAAGWAHGVKPHSLAGLRGKAKLSIETLPSPRGLITSPNSTTTSLSEEGSSSTSCNGESSSCLTPPPPPPPSSASISGSYSWPSVDGTRVLDCARILLAPVAKRQRLRAAMERTSRLAKKKPSMISIPLHGPRVEIILAWLGAVHLPELDAYP
ncbi:hypothetical protein H2248_001504 [Termitomyces sp. 'cryptogamus']|nr:hypothetical protein H2248_001504 [Termitomyces sp. 'cryptogamus']